MIKRIKKILIFGILFLILFGIFKDKYFDTPAACRHRVQSCLQDILNKQSDVDLVGSDKELTYSMYFWSIIPMGILKFSVENEGDRVVSIEADTNDSWIGDFFQASASFKSYFQKEDNSPRLYIEQTRVREKTRLKEILFDQKTLIAERDGVKIKIPKNTFDPLSAVVYAFTLPYEENAQQEVRFLSKEEIYILKASLVEKKDDIYKIKMEMRREDLSSNHGATIYVWITADAARIPLLFKSWTPAGFASIVLKNMKIKG